MPRHARITLPGVPLHIVHRGTNRADCFWTPGDRNLDLCLLDEFAALHGCAIHAYVLMTNHVHLLVTPRHEEAASLMMKSVAQRYVQFVNRKRGRTGGLWEGRFKSSLIESELYLLRCHRYIEMNPVRARMAAAPGDFAWSSFAANARGRSSTLVTPHDRYLALGSTGELRQSAYAALFRIPTTDEELRRIRDAVNGGFALGSESFIAEVERTLGRTATRAFPRNARADNVPSNGTGGLTPV